MPELPDLIRPGSTVAFSDGAGMPTSVLGEVSRTAARTGGVQLLLGWCLAPLSGLVPGTFKCVVSVMGGYAARQAIDHGQIGYIPVRTGSVPTLVRESLRPDVLVASVVPGPDGHRFATEVSWLRAVVDSGAVIAAVERPEAPVCDAGPPLPADRVNIIGSCPTPPYEMHWREPADKHRAVAEHVVRLIPEGARVQLGPGPIATAVCDALRVRVHVDSGLLTDAVLGLDRRGLLIDQPLGTYLAGTASFYEWARHRPLLQPIEVTHDPTRLACGPPLIAINTALEIDLDGQVNVEAVGGSAIAGIGGHPDYAFAAARSIGGLSVIALTTRRASRWTLVERLSAPVSTPGHDVDVVVNEHGFADLRGADRRQRRHAIAALWEVG